MKKISLVPFLVGLMTASLICACQSKREAPVVGTLTAFYALEDFTVDDMEYKKGQLICDSNDPLNRVVDKNADFYLYEGDDGGEGYSWLLPKSKVEQKTYTMNALSTEDVGNKSVFVSDGGLVARVFWATINGHHYKNWNGEEEIYRESDRLRECYVLSVEYKSSWDNSRLLFEDPLEEKQGNLELYQPNPYAGEESASDNCRTKEGPIGLIIDGWYNEDGWPYDKSAYDEDGKLLCDQLESCDIPDYISIAYIAELNALYVNGQLYYRHNSR